MALKKGSPILRLMALALPFAVTCLAFAQTAAAQIGKCQVPQPFAIWVNRVIVRSEPGFTEGLIYDDGRLLESTGNWHGVSRLNSIDLSNGKVTGLINTPDNLFGEGIVKMGDTVLQLTYKEKKIFAYDLKTRKLTATLENSFSAEGWGAAMVDASTMLVSDGSNKLYFLDPQTLAVKRTLEVTDLNGAVIRLLNHLLVVGNDVFINPFAANTFYVLRVDLNTGCVNGFVDARQVLNFMTNEERQAILANPDSVMNGMAFNPQIGHFYLTGKNWSKIFEVSLFTPNARPGLLQNTKTN